MHRDHVCNYKGNVSSSDSPRESQTPQESFRYDGQSFWEDPSSTVRQWWINYSESYQQLPITVSFPTLLEILHPCYTYLLYLLLTICTKHSHILTGGEYERQFPFIPMRMLEHVRSDDHHNDCMKLKSFREAETRSILFISRYWTVSDIARHDAKRTVLNSSTPLDYGILNSDK